MIKRLFIILSVIFAILCISSISFAATNNTALTNMTDGAINGTQRLVQDGANALGTGVNAINNGIGASRKSYEYW